MPTVQFGNTAATHQGQILMGNRVTTAQIPDEYSLSEQLLALVADSTQGAQHDGVWRSHSAAPVPAWVETTDATLTAAIAEHYGCPVGRPDDWV